MSFEAICNELPDCPGPDDLPIIENPGGFTYITHGLPEFVGPDLAVTVEGDEPSGPSITIISAAGAVGKSTLARQIASRKRAPIWDLAQAEPVGGKTADGQLIASFGFDVAAKVSELLSGGHLFLIVDALDEARVRANEAGYGAFVHNLADIANRASGTSFVLFARTQTAEDTWLQLQNAGVSTSLLSVQPFTRPQAEEYIELRIRHSDPVAAKRIDDHPQPFVQARDLIFNHLERAVRGGDTKLAEAATREFLGYAPVLETVALLLAKETNYADIIARLGGSESLHPARQLDHPLAVLHHVVTRLLEREQQEKLVDNIRPALEGIAAEHGWSSWKSLYSPREQRLRLLGCVLSRDFDPSPAMPAALRARYEEQLETWFPEHPFLREGTELRNKVFESYLFATALREYLTDMSRVVENRVNAADYKPSRLLADFYILLNERSRSDAVPAKHIGLLYDSLLAGETDSLRVRLSVEAGDPDDADEGDTSDEGEFELVYAAPDTDEEEQIEVRSFTIAEDSGVIAFRRHLKDGTIVTNGTVWLGGDIDDFEVGPSVDVRCRKLEIHSSGLVVRAAKAGSSETQAVVLEAGECISAVSRRPIVRGILYVSWPDAEAYPWTDYATGPEPVETSDEQMHSVYRRFRRIVMTLRSHGRGSLARLRDKVEHERVMRGQLAPNGIRANWPSH